jgi:protein tyrosine phosphatase
MNEPSHRFWDTIIKAGTALAAIAVFVPSFLQYKSESANNVLMIELERGKFLLQQSKDDIKSLSEAIKTVRLIQFSKTQEDLVKAITKFWQLYWADLAGVEDKNVELAMVKIGEIIKDNEINNQLGNWQSNKILDDAAKKLNIACLNQISRIKKDIKKLALTEP